MTPSALADADFATAWAALTQWPALVAVLGGAIASGLIAGLTGFGTALVALGLWLYVLPPQVAVPLVCISGSVAHISGMALAVGHVPVARAAALVGPGIVGLPLGVTLLTWVDGETLKPVAGALILGVSLSLLVLGLMRGRSPASAGASSARGSAQPAMSEPPAQHLLGLGFVGGVLGGLAGFSGAIPALYAQIFRWPKATQRDLFQLFNLTIMALALVGYALSGLFGPALALCAALVVPITLLAAAVGRRLFHVVDEDLFRRIILVMLIISGGRLLLTAG